MDTKNWTGRSAAVTGAASGIGLALSRALAQRGVKVYMADIDTPRLLEAAASIGPQAQYRVVDVRDSLAVREFIEWVVQDAGGIDYLFNNAGLAVAAEAHEMAVEHYDRIIDVNIRGVVHGIAAAYPIMVGQRSGHIVNTASLAGITPVPLLVAYAMSKHAIVGLSTSLRIEAAFHGVRVSAICPAAVETPLLDAPAPAGLPGIAWRPDIRGFLEQAAGKPYPVERLVEEALRGVERNLPLIVLPTRAKLVALLYRLFPSLVAREIGKAADAQRRTRPKNPSGNGS